MTLSTDIKVLQRQAACKHSCARGMADKQSMCVWCGVAEVDIDGLTQALNAAMWAAHAAGLATGVT